MLQENLSLHVVSVSSPSSQPMHCGQNKKRLEFIIIVVIIIININNNSNNNLFIYFN